MSEIQHIGDKLLIELGKRKTTLIADVSVPYELAKRFEALSERERKLQWALSKALQLCAEAYQYVGTEGEGRDQQKMCAALSHDVQVYDELVSEEIFDLTSETDPYEHWIPASKL